MKLVEITADRSSVAAKMSEFILDGDYVINDDGSVDGSGVLQLPEGCQQIPVKFRKFDGEFIISDVPLSHLTNAPEVITGNLGIFRTNIKSYKNIHKIIKEVNGLIFCDVAESMVGLTLIRKVKQITTTNDDNQIGTILTRHIGDPLAAQDALFDAGFKEQARL